ncbi:unnamed protein product [Thelazia callipaeda]|uniref:Secreted protein n=1 Tax=Thelazia callipaeda TaxID=103827 RepID=A0A0N5CYR8_THECL|nr:unnamed protein product [Thelazia callipaeda]
MNLSHKAINAIWASMFIPYNLCILTRGCSPPTERYYHGHETICMGRTNIGLGLVYDMIKAICTVSTPVCCWSSLKAIVSMACNKINFSGGAEIRHHV